MTGVQRFPGKQVEVEQIESLATNVLQQYPKKMEISHYRSGSDESVFAAPREAKKWKLNLETFGFQVYSS